VSARADVPRIVGSQGLTRQAFLLRSVLTTGLVAGGSAVGPLVQRAFAQPQTTDVSILDFALTLQQFEATFYADALEQLALTGEARAYAAQFQPMEDAHVEEINAALDDLGAEGADLPEFDWGKALQSQASFVKHAAQFEDIVVSAMNGAGPMLQDKGILQGGGGIVQVDARQAALLRVLNGQSPMVAAFDQTLTQEQALDAMAPYTQD
jgi:hypothetical protein